MRLIRILTLIFIGLMTAQTVCAAPIELNLIEAVDLAFENNQDFLYQDVYGLRTAELSRQSSLAAYKSQSSLSLGANQTGSRTLSSSESGDRSLQGDLSWNLQVPFKWGSFVTFTAGMDLSRRDSLSGDGEYSSSPYLGLSWSQPLSHSGIKAGQGSLRRIETGYENARLNFQRARENLIYQTISSYFRLFEARQALDLAEKQFDLTNNLLNLSQVRLEAGEIAELDLIQIKVQRVEEEANLMALKRSLRSNRLDFLEMLGLETETQIELTTSPEEAIKFLAVENPSFEDALAKAMTHRIDLKQSDINLELAELSMQETVSANKTRLSLNSKYQRSGSNEKFSGLTDDASQSWQVGASVDFSLLDGGRDKTGIENARISLDQARYSRQELERSIRKEIENIVEAIKTDEARLNILKVNLSIVEESFKISQIKYEEGMITSDDVLRSQLALFRMKDTIDRTNISLIINMVGLFKAEGVLVEEYEAWKEAMKEDEYAQKDE
ncbi:MAG: TolC family protein [bacterium]